MLRNNAVFLLPRVWLKQQRMRKKYDETFTFQWPSSPRMLAPECHVLSAVVLTLNSRSPVVKSAASQLATTTSNKRDVRRAFYKIKVL